MTMHAAPSSRDLVEPITITASDGLTLRGRHFHATPARPAARPVLCLAGLTRNGRDFDALAHALSHGPDARDVYTLDMRGRGASEFDRNWKNYAISTELGDVIDCMTVLGLFDAAIIGTSRGGLIAMAMMAVQPTRVGAIVLNDIGPVIETEGLLRIAGYVGKIPQPSSWPEAVTLLKKTAGRDFPKLSDDDWETLARQWYNARDGRPVAGYDPALAKSFTVTDAGIPPLWPQFKAATRVPVMAIRGENSDLLSAETVRQMALLHPDFTDHSVPNEGHAPLLRDEPTIAAICAFLKRTD